MLQQLPRLSPVSSWIAGARSESLWPMERHVAWCFTGWLGLPMDSAMRYGKPKQISESKSLTYVQTCENNDFFHATNYLKQYHVFFFAVSLCDFSHLSVDPKGHNSPKPCRRATFRRVEPKEKLQQIHTKSITCITIYELCETCI